MIKTFAFTLDLEKAEIFPTGIVVSAGDYNVIELTISLTQDGGPLDITGLNIVLRTKATGAVIQTPCEIIDALGGVLRVVLPSESNSKTGLWIAELAVLEGSTVRGIPNQFNYTVKTSLFTESATEAENPVPPYHQEILDSL